LDVADIARPLKLTQQWAQSAAQRRNPPERASIGASRYQIRAKPTTSEPAAAPPFRCLCCLARSARPARLVSLFRRVVGAPGGHWRSELNSKGRSHLRPAFAVRRACSRTWRWKSFTQP